jgi:two-component system chemotaxis sensor kinase CheA
VAIIKALLVEAGGQTFAIPSSQVSEVVRIKKSDVKKLGLVDVVEVRGKVVPLLRLNDLLNIRNALQSEYYEIVIANVDRKGRKYGLAVDSILRLQEILVKPLDLMLSSLRGFGGVTILGSGQVVLVLDVPKLIEKERS